MSAHDEAVEAAAKVRAAEEYEKPWKELKPEQRAWCLRQAGEMQAAYLRHMRAAGFDLVPSADARAAEAAMRERAASEVDCACPGRETVLNVTANGTAQTNSAMRWTACGRATCCALEAAAIRALPLTGDKP